MPSRVQYKWPQDYEKLSKAVDSYFKKDVEVRSKADFRLFIGVTKDRISEWQIAKERFGNQTYGKDDDTSFRSLIEDAHDRIRADLQQKAATAKLRGRNENIFLYQLNNDFYFRENQDIPKASSVSVKVVLPEDEMKYAK